MNDDPLRTGRTDSDDPAVTVATGFEQNASADDSLALPLGSRVAEFVITGLVGIGGFGIVYRAHDETLGRVVALKEYMPSALAFRPQGQTVSVKSLRQQDTFAAGLRSFVNEARMLALFDHPALVKVYRFWEANGTAYMVMPLYEGKTLKNTLAEMPAPPSEDWLREVFVPLLDALELIHGKNCFHRDIAPDNIYLQPNGQPVLLDFGAARQVIGDMANNLTVILKPGYAPIEQYASDPNLPQGPWTDVYALGAVLHHAITGRAPSAAVGRLVKDVYQPLSGRIPGYSQDFLQAIDRSLAVKQADRPQGIVEFRALLGWPASPAAASVPRTIMPPVASAAPGTPPRTHSRTVAPAISSPANVPEQAPGKGLGSLAWVLGGAAVAVGAGVVWFIGADKGPVAGVTPPVAIAPPLAAPAAPAEPPATNTSTAPPQPPDTTAAAPAPAPEPLAAAPAAPQPAVAPAPAAKPAAAAPAEPRAAQPSRPAPRTDTRVTPLEAPPAPPSTARTDAGSNGLGDATSARNSPPNPPAPAHSPAAPQARPAPAAGVAPMTGSSNTAEWLVSLRKALERCESKNFLEKVFCREKARWKHCEPGHWNEVPECEVEKSPNKP